MEDSRTTIVNTLLAKINFKRLLAVIGILFFVETLFLFYVERVRLQNATGDMYDLVLVSYLLHLALAIFLVIMFVWIYKRYKNNAFDDSIVERLPVIVVGVSLIFSAIISMFDQITVGHITVFTAKMLIFGLLIFIKPPKNFFVYSIPFGLFIFGILLFQDSQELIVTHLINGFAVYAGIMFASTRFYQHKFYDLHYRMTLKKINKQLEDLSTLDPLTGLPNRRYFEKQLKYERAIARRYKTEATLLLIDIDFFKEINDTYGHNPGDKVLCEIADILSDNVRESDTVSRWGGEEFMILLSHTPLEGAEILSGRLLKTIENTVFLKNEHDIKLTVSIGIAPLVTEAFEESYELVDKALYQSKNNGRNQYTTLKK